MAVREIKIYPDPVLRENCEPVKEITDEILKLIDDMVDTMYDAPGVGLAAPQIGVAKRVIVADIGDDEETGTTSKLYKIINPVITHKEGNVSSEEGCLSIPEIRETIKRYESVVVEGFDENWKKISVEASGFLAFCFQHEIDHINGVLFIDHLSKLKQTLVKSKIKKQRRQNL